MVLDLPPVFAGVFTLVLSAAFAGVLALDFPAEFAGVAALDLPAAFAGVLTLVLPVTFPTLALGVETFAVLVVLSTVPTLRKVFVELSGKGFGKKKQICP